MGSSTSKGNISTALLVITIIAIAILVGVLAELMITNGVRAGKYNNPNVATQVVRGTIYDRNGRPLAIEVPENNLYLNTTENLDTLSQILAVNLSRTPSEILSILDEADVSEPVLIQRNLDSSTIARITEELQSNNLPPGSISIVKEYARTYPAAFHGAQFIQETESVFNKVLSPNPGFDESTTYGNDVYLTIDLDIQYLLDLTIQQIYEMQRPDYAVGFVLDISTGELLASTTYPFYNLNDSANTPDSYKVSKTLVSSIIRPDIRINEIKTISKVVAHDTEEPITDYSLNGSYTIDLEPIKSMVEDPDGYTSMVARVSEENPKYLVFLGSINPRFYQISSVLEYAVTSLEQGLAAQTKL